MSIQEVLEFIEENDVKFIRLGFCDPLGNQKNISIMASEIERAFTTGIPFDGSSIKGFSDIKNSDLLLFPDITTLSLLPWRPNMNSVLRFYCDIKNPDGTDFINDGRYILKQTIQDMNNNGFSCRMGTDFEFYLFKTNENGEPTKVTLDKGSFLDISPLDKGENIRREICLCLEQMGLRPERSHHDQGPGQNQIDFKFSDVLTSADHFMTFKTVVKSIAARNGLFASFMPKPFLDKSGNRLSINLSVFKDGENIFSNEDSQNYKYAKSFIAGILAKIEEITIFLNTNNNSYERFGQHEAPQYTSWSHLDRSQLIRLSRAQLTGKEKIEITSPDPAVNPYIAVSMLLRAGMYGIENNLVLDDSIDQKIKDGNTKIVESLNRLPKNLGEAIEKTENSSFVKDCLGNNFLNKYIACKKEEYHSFSTCRDKEQYYTDTYFEQL